MIPPRLHTTAHRLGFLGGTKLKTVTSFLWLSPIPSPSSRTLQAQKSPRNGSDITDTISGTSPGKHRGRLQKTKTLVLFRASLFLGGFAVHPPHTNSTCRI
ncbi:hypothetical protein GOODEAATRI_016184 [Goodea atripinnis]|uniref:Uncharacterized protein n=1 Tax=Goodea atripinnis TaxID=208336 RepID=A0ABV0PYQ5_9TELE